MAGEIKLTFSCVISKGGAYSTTPTATSYTLDMGGTRTGSLVQTLSTTDEQLDFGEISPANGVLWVKNLSATAGESIELSSATGGSFVASRFMYIPPSGFAFFKPNTSTIYARSSAGTPSIQWGACD